MGRQLRHCLCHKCAMLFCDLLYFRETSQKIHNYTNNPLLSLSRPKTHHDAHKH